MRELEIVVTADTLQARQAFKTLDADIAKVTTSASGTDQSLDALNAQLDKFWGPVNKVTASVKDFGQAIKQEAVLPLETLVVSEVEADRALSDFHISLQKSPGFLSQARSGLNGLAEALGITFVQLGLIRTGFMVAGAAATGWEIGRLISGLGGLDKKIGDVTASLLGYDKQLASEVAGAKQEALAYAALQRINTIEQATKIEQNWHNEIAKLGPATTQFVKDIESHNFSLRELALRYAISQGAIENFEHELKESAAEAKRSADFTLQEHKKQETAAKELAQAYLKLHLNVARGLEQMTKESEKQLAEWTKVVNAALQAEFEAQVKLNAAQGLDAAGAIQVQTTALSTLQKSLIALHATKAEGISQAAQEQVLMNEFTKSLYDEAVAADKARDASAGLNAEAANVVPTMAAATAAVSAFATAAINGMAGVPIAVNGVMRDLFGRPVAGQGASTIFHDSTPFQQRAGGGPVSAGSPYMVGERGPELFVPNASGSIMPSGSGAPIVNNFYINGSIQDLARPLIAEIDRSLRQGRKLPAN